MNDKQLDQARINLRQEMNAAGYGWIDGKYIKPPTKYERQKVIFDCIDMINSTLAYQCEGYKDGEAVLEHEENSWRNYLADYVEKLGREKVVALIQEQIDSIAGVEHGVFTDDEGLTYNSIVWKEN